MSWLEPRLRYNGTWRQATILHFSPLLHSTKPHTLGDRDPGPFGTEHESVVHFGFIYIKVGAGERWVMGNKSRQRGKKVTEVRKDHWWPWLW